MAIDMQRALNDFWAARQPGGPYPLEWESALTQDDAYRIQLGLLERHAKRGEKQVGWKVGLTARVIREQFGFVEPLFACLFEHGKWPSGRTWPLAKMNGPGFENELCITLGERLQGPGITEDRARHAIATVAPAMEIIETRGPNTMVGFNTMLADNGQQYSFVVGTPVKFDPASHDLGTASVEVYIDGKFEDKGFGHAVMDTSAAASVAWLANKLAAFGLAIEPGQSLMTGSFTRQFKIDRPMTVEARFTPFGSAIATFA